MHINPDRQEIFIALYFDSKPKINPAIKINKIKAILLMWLI